MKANVSVAALTSALEVVLPTIDKKNSNPLLTNVLLTASEAGGGSLKLTGTDNFIGGSASVGAEVTEGAIAVEAHRMFAIVSNMPKKKMASLTLRDSHVELKCGSSKYKLPCLPADDFPPMPRLTKSAQRREFDASALHDCITWTSHAMTNDQNRPHLSGLLLDVLDGGQLNVVGCDGHQMVKANADASANGTKVWQAFIPYRAVPIVKRLCADAEGQVSMATTKSHVFFWDGTTGFNAKMLGGDPLPYDSIVPAESTRLDATVSVKAMSDALKRISAIEDNAVDVFVQSKSVHLTAQTAMGGEGAEKLGAGTRGKPLSVSFSIKDLAAAFGVMTTEKAAIHLWGERKPGMFRPVTEDEDHTVLAVLMPMVKD